MRARLPLADWTKPAIWLMPRNSSYGGWPASGEIDLMESSGNRGFHCHGQSRGVDSTQFNVHFGPTRFENDVLIDSYRVSQKVEQVE